MHIEVLEVGVGVERARDCCCAVISLVRVSGSVLLLLRYYFRP